MSISMRPYAEVEWLILIMTQHDGFRLSSNVYQISIFGVVIWIMGTGIVIYGFRARIR